MYRPDGYAGTGTELGAEVLDAIRRFDVCTISNAVETFNVRPANEGFTDGSIRCLAGGGQGVLGYAATGLIQGSDVPITRQRCGDREGWWEYVLAAPPPRIVVLQDASGRPGFGSFLGEVHSAILLRLGSIGAITNGAVRDLPAVEAMGFALFGSRVAVSHCYARVVDFGKPVEIGGLRIAPGDLIYGDRHGILSIPKQIAAELPEAAARLVEREQRILDVCRSTEFSLEKLRAAVCAK